MRSDGTTTKSHAIRDRVDVCGERCTVVERQPPSDRSGESSLGSRDRGDGGGGRSPVGRQLNIDCVSGERSCERSERDSRTPLPSSVGASFHAPSDRVSTTVGWGAEARSTEDNFDAILKLESAFLQKKMRKVEASLDSRMHEIASRLRADLSGELLNQVMGMETSALRKLQAAEAAVDVQVRAAAGRLAEDLDARLAKATATSPTPEEMQTALAAQREELQALSLRVGAKLAVATEATEAVRDGQQYQRLNEVEAGSEGRPTTGGRSCCPEAKAVAGLEAMGLRNEFRKELDELKEQQQESFASLQRAVAEATAQQSAAHRAASAAEATAAAALSRLDEHGEAQEAKAAGAKMTLAKLQIDLNSVLVERVAMNARADSLEVKLGRADEDRAAGLGRVDAACRALVSRIEDCEQGMLRIQAQLQESTAVPLALPSPALPLSVNSVHSGETQCFDIFDASEPTDPSSIKELGSVSAVKCSLDALRGDVERLEQELTAERLDRQHALKSLSSEVRADLCQELRNTHGKMREEAELQRVVVTDRIAALEVNAKERAEISHELRNAHSGTRDEAELQAATKRIAALEEDVKVLRLSTFASGSMDGPPPCASPGAFVEAQLGDQCETSSASIREALAEPAHPVVLAPTHSAPKQRSSSPEAATILATASPCRRRAASRAVSPVRTRAPCAASSGVVQSSGASWSLEETVVRRRIAEFSEFEDVSFGRLDVAGSSAASGASIGERLDNSASSADAKGLHAVASNPAPAAICGSSGNQAMGVAHECNSRLAHTGLCPPDDVEDEFLRGLAFGCRSRPFGVLLGGD